MRTTGRTVAIVGGGLAGTSAATILAERGVAVKLFESNAYLGGRLGAWSDTRADGTSFEMERGFHAFFRQYYNLRSFLRRVDPDLKHLVPLKDYPLVGPDGSTQSFRRLPRTAPFNVAALVWRSPHLRLEHLRQINARAAFEMLRFDSERTYAEYDRMSAAEYLRELNFPPAARQMLFDVFSHSFFNPEDNYSAAELLMMFHFYFLGNREGLIFDGLGSLIRQRLVGSLEAVRRATWCSHPCFMPRRLHH